MIRRLVSRMSARRNYSSMMSSSEALLETLRAHNVQRVYGIVGSAFMNPLHSFPTAGIKFISVQHEQNAVHMADGYARSTGDWGVCIGQNGPGVSNMVTGIATAYYAHSPVVMITPQASNKTMGYGMFQEVDQMSMFEKITKYQVQVNDPTRIAEELANCFHYAKLYNGPVQLNIPREYLFGDALQYVINGPKKISLKTPANPDLVNEAAQLLCRAKNPVILAGGGAGNSRAQVAKLAENLGAGVVTTYLHNDSFPSDHPLACGALGYMGSKTGMKLISSADVVLALGTRLSTFGLTPQYEVDYWPKNAKVIQVDINADAVGKTKNIDIGLVGDSGLVCDQLLGTGILGHLRQHFERKHDLIAKISTMNKEWAMEMNQLADDSQNRHGRIAPRKALRELFKHIPDNSIVTTDIGNICSLTNNYLNCKNPRSFLGSMTYGSCGTALPTAMGAKIGNPNKTLFSIVGDGAWGMSFFELQTAIRENIPVINVVFNNQQWGAEKKNQVIWFGDQYIGTNLKNPNFAAVAEAMGANGYNCITENEIRNAVQDALAKENRGKPSVIEIAVTRELVDPFRRDSMQLPKRFLEKYVCDNLTEESLTGQPTDI